MEKIKLLTRISYLMVILLCVLFAYEHIYKIYQLEIKLVNQNLNSVFTGLRENLRDEVVNARSTLTFFESVIKQKIKNKSPFTEERLRPIMSPLISSRKNQFNLYFALEEDESRQFFNQEGVVFSIHKNKANSDKENYNDISTFLLKIYHDPKYQHSPVEHWYQTGKKSKDVEVTDIYFDHTYLNVWMFSVVKGVFSKDKFVGVVAVDFFLDSFLENISKEMNKINGSLALIDNKTKKVFAHPDQQMAFDLQNLNVNDVLGKELTNQKFKSSQSGKSYILNSFPLRDLPWTIVAIVDQDSIYAEVFSKVKVMLAGCFIILLFNLFIVFLLFRYLNKFYFDIITQNQSKGITRLAEGLCHEINNPLATLSLCQGAIKRLLKRELQNSTINGLMTKSERASEKIQVIIKKLQDISITNPELELKSTSMGDIVDELKMIFSEDLATYQIDFSLDASDGGIIDCDPLKMLQALMPLIENSIEEVKHLEERWIRVTVEKGRNGTTINIMDSGKGVKKGIHEKIFLPFFTTKTKELKKGLGLTVAQSFIEQQGGTLSYVANSKNTTFRIYFPVMVAKTG